METETTSVTIVDGSYCKVDWQKEGDNIITVLGPTQAWSGTLDNRLLESAAKKLGDCPLEDAVKEAKTAFGGNIEKYSVSVENDKLFWKKLTRTSNGMKKLKLVEVQLQELPDIAKVQKTLMETLIKDNQGLQKTNKDLQRRNDNLRKTLRDHQATLELFTKEKNELEENLYSKFIPILNAKKEEIVRLRDSEAIDNGGEELIEEDGNNYDADTDVEEEENGVGDASSKRLKTEDNL